MATNGGRINIFMGENPYGINTGNSYSASRSSMGRRKKRKSSPKKKRRYYRKRRYYKKVKGRRYTPHTAGKRKDRSHRRIRYTKRGQPYIIMGNGRAKFISYKSAHISHKRKGGRY